MRQNPKIYDPFEKNGMLGGLHASEFPYVFRNQMEFSEVTDSITQAKEFLKMSQKSFNELKMEEGFKYSYYTLLRSIADKDLDTLKQVCERNLYNSFEGTLPDLFDPTLLSNSSNSVDKINLLNDDEDWMQNMNVSFIYMIRAFGCRIDRMRNKELGVQLASEVMPKSKIFKDRDIYIQTMNPEPTLKMALKVLVRVETNLKLDLVFKDGSRLIPEDEREDTEIHHIQMENEYAEFSPGIIGGLKVAMHMYWPKFNFTDWVVTDFDSYLLGNPVVPEERGKVLKEANLKKKDKKE